MKTKFHKVSKKYFNLVTSSYTNEVVGICGTNAKAITFVWRKTTCKKCLRLK